MCKIECKFEVLLDFLADPEGERALAQAGRSRGTAMAPIVTNARSACSFDYRTQIRSQQATPKESQLKDEFGFSGKI
jgi:hypothetical protein